MKLNIPNCECLCPPVHPPPVHTLQCPLVQLQGGAPCLALLALGEKGWRQEGWVEDLLLIWGCTCMHCGRTRHFWWVLQTEGLTVQSLDVPCCVGNHHLQKHFVLSGNKQRNLTKKHHYWWAVWIITHTYYWIKTPFMYLKPICAYFINFITSKFEHVLVLILFLSS